MSTLESVIAFRAAPSATTTIHYSHGVGVTDTHPEQRVAATFQSLAQIILGDPGPTIPADLNSEGLAFWKASASLPWIAQPMSGNGHRLKTNAQPWQLLILDVDGVRPQPDKTAWDTLSQLVDAVRQRAPCFGWFTASHTRECPRARLVLHLDRPVDSVEAKRLALALNADLSEALGVAVGPAKDNPRVVIDPTMQDAGHIAFGPLVDCGRIALREDAGALNVDSWLARVPVGTTPLLAHTTSPVDVPRLHTPKAEAEVRAALVRLDQRHPDAVHDRTPWLRVLAALKAHGWPDAVMEPVARAWSEQSPKFDPARWSTDWQSLKVEGGITPATLFYLAGQAEDNFPAFGTHDGICWRWRVFLDGRAMHARGRWYAWVGSHWRPDSGQVAAWLKDFAREQADETARAHHADATDTNKAARAKTARSLLNQPVQDHVLRAATTLLRIDDADLDRNDYLLACSNGTVNLRDGTLKPADPNDRITLCTGHDFDPAATCPAWTAFTAEALDDPETEGWFQRFIGLSATGDVQPEKMLLALGPSGTGKSTALKAIMYALGGEVAATSYCTAASSALLSDTGKRRSASEHTGGMTPLVGKRLVAVNEVRRGEAWDDSIFKQLVSREPIQMREVGGARAFNVLPTWKIWVRGNHRPNIRDVTDAFFRRVALLEFKRKPLAANHGLDARLRAEAQGILAWIVRGALAYQKVGLALPRAMQEALDSYRSEQDLFGEWLTIRTEPGAFTLGAAVRHDYATFAGLTHHPPTEKAFAGMMRERGYEPIKKNGNRGFAVVFRPDHDLV